MTFKQARIAKGLTQGQIAEKLNVLPSAVNHWERGRWKPCRKYHKKLAKLLGVTTYQLESMFEEEE